MKKKRKKRAEREGGGGGGGGGWREILSQGSGYTRANESPHQSFFLDGERREEKKREIETSPREEPRWTKRAGPT